MKMIKAFTILELILVIIIASIIAGFAIPSFVKSRNRADESRVIQDLAIIREAARRYLIVNNETALGAWADADAINTALNIGVIPPENFSYDCVPGPVAGDNNICTVGPDDSSWDIHFHDILPTAQSPMIHCTDTSCPTCSNEAGGGCDP